MKKKVITTTLSLAMAFSMMAGPAYADDSAPAPDSINIGAGVLSTGSNTTTAQTVYMADKLWRVMGYGGHGVASTADTVALISSGNIKTSIKFNPDYEASDANHYSNSNLKAEVDAVADTFSAEEKSGIASRTLVSGSFSRLNTDCVAGDPVDNALLWPLSAKEANALSNSLRMVDHMHQQEPVNTWWLRSPGSSNNEWAGFVLGDGGIGVANNGFGTRVTNEYGVRPAFNYNLNSILFTSAASGGKTSGSISPDALTQVGSNEGSEWKLTVLDKARNNFAVSDTTTSDNNVTVTYTGAQTGTNEYISAIITDKAITAEGAKVKYYGRIKNCTGAGDASGTVTINTAGKLSDKDYLYVFSEQHNGNPKTDYSSPLQEAIAPKPELTITARDQSFAYNGENQGPADTVYSDPAEIAEMVNVSGLEEGDTLSEIRVAGQGKEEGEYVLTPSAAMIGEESAAEKYLVNYVSGKLTITHACRETAKVAPTCTQPGTEAYWTCEGCNKMFSDKDGKNEITEPVTIPATGHKYGPWTKLNGTQHQRVCEHDRTHVEKATHTWDAGKVTRKATEQAVGIKTYTCSICKGTRTETIPKLKPSASKVNGTPLMKMTAKGNTNIVINWNRIQGAAGYDLFFARCNYDNKKFITRKVKTIKGNSTFKWTMSGLKKGKAYKACVKAYVIKNGKKTYVRTSPIMHAYSGNGTKNYTNARSVSVNRTVLTLNKGKTFQIKGKVNKVRKNRKLMSKNHAPTLRYMTSNSKIAVVNGSGKITARSAGKCYVYVLAHNGVSKQIRITVKDK